MNEDVQLRFDRATKQYALVGCDEVLSTKFTSFIRSLSVRGLSDKTARAYSFDILHLSRWLIKSKKNFRLLSQASLLEWVSLQRSENAKPKSINRRLSVCHIFYRFSFNREIKHVPGANFSKQKLVKNYDDVGLPISYLTKNVQLKVKVPKILIEALEPHDVSRFLESFEKYRDLSILLLMLLAGLRSHEVLSLQIADLNFSERTMKVHGKGGKQRMLPLFSTLATAVRRYLHFERPRGVKEPALFVVLQGKNRGKPMTASGLRSLFRNRRRRTGVEKANPHKFRHCFGTEMAKAGMQLATLKDMMGHSNIKITLQYIQLSMKDLSAEYEKAVREVHSRYEKT